MTGKLDGAWTGAVGHTAPQIPDEEHRKKKKRKAEAADLRCFSTFNFWRTFYLLVLKLGMNVLVLLSN